ncbi:S8 family serine peptidase [Fictibacillus sp. WQ 8-8]|uniref:S8 family serine peptidase n=1 Tax=Fictibacillus sp. WQ 8-8 TaxID=2938788 RepID=UPI00210CBCB0|nr:S8 family serine peptidase [Fictibacillus sp. WQ 8-8]MCQ6266861.1 S8 family serine peptidase [Fictibacillus sp. WQ 8-8]
MKQILSIFAVLMLISTIAGNFKTPEKASAATLEVDPALTQVLNKVSDSVQVEGVITYSEMPGVSQLNQLKDLGLQTRTFHKLPMVAVKGTKADINSLLNANLGAESIYYNKKLEYKLKDSRGLIGAEKVWNELGYTGKGTTVAVIDSGIDATHKDLPIGDKVVQNVKFLTGNSLFESSKTLYAENIPNTDTTSGHGTHVAGTIAGNGTQSDGLYKGIAPDAKLVGLGTGEAISVLWALEAFDYTLENQQKYGIDVISNSWGTTGTYSAKDPINVASKKAHDAGMVVSFAAGNEGPDENTINPYSVAPWVISVAAGTKDKQLADFSSRGVKGDPLLHPDITAPGVDIVSTKSSTGMVMNLLGTKKDATYIAPEHLPYYTTASGTSMATPHISGVAALMLEANPSLQPDRVLQLMQSTADPMSGYEEHEAGAGYVNAYEAVKAAKQ